MIIATGSRVRLTNIRVKDLEPASAHKFTLSITEPLTNLKRLRVIYDRNGFWTEDAGAAAIVAMEDKRLLGALQFYRSGPGIHGYEIGYILHDESDRGKGYASEAVRLFSDYLFEQRPGCHRLQLIIETWNDASVRLAEACGYQREGVLRRAGYSSDIPEDCFLYARVRGG